MALTALELTVRCCPIKVDMGKVDMPESLPAFEIAILAESGMQQ
jgi:hypothetical protein